MLPKLSNLVILTSDTKLIINHLGIQEVMPMIEHSSNMGLLVDDNQLRAGAVL